MPFRLLTRLSVLLFVVLLLPSLALAQSSNLIANSAFETEANNLPAGWTKTYWGSPTPTFQYPVTGRTGNGAAISYNNTSTGDARWQHTPVAVEAGKAYVYSNWHKSTAATEINIAYTNASGQISYAWLATLPSTDNNWREAKVQFAIPQNMSKASIFHLLDKSGTLTIDDVQLSLVGSTTPPATPTTTPPVVGNTFTEGMVSITFDDSWLSQYTTGMPILDAAGVKGTFYITTEPIQNGWSGFMSLAQMKDIVLKGHELGGHTTTHADLATLSNRRISSEIRTSKTYIQNQTGTAVTSLAYPYGSYSTAVISQTKQAGYTNARGVIEGLVKKTDDKFTLKSHSIGPSTPLSSIKTYIDQAKANKEWYILTLHEIEVGGDEYSTTPNDLQAIVDYIKSTGIKVVTMRDGVAAMSQ